MFRFDPYSHMGRELGLMQRAMDDLFQDAGRFNVICLEPDQAALKNANGQIAATDKQQKQQSSKDTGLDLSRSQLQSVALRPRVDVRFDKEGNAVVIHAELPGVPKDQVNINFKDGALSISGTSKKDISEKDEKLGWIYEERQVGKFFRSFPLPETDEDNIKATFVDGVLKITCPQRKPVESEGKTIAIGN